MPLPDVTFPNTPDFYRAGVYLSGRPSREAKQASPEEIVKSLNTAHDNLRKQVSFDSQIRRGCMELTAALHRERTWRIWLTVFLALNVGATLGLYFR